MSLIWKQIPQWPDYEVSERGDVRRCRPGRNGWTGNRVPYLSATGYLMLAMRQDGYAEAVAVHRLVAMAFIGPAPTPEHQAAHGDGDKLNNHWTNLRWCTRAENERDKILHGRTNRGERQGRAKLTAEAVRRIRGLIDEGLDNIGIAARFDVARQTINSIRVGRSWAWLQ